MTLDEAIKNAEVIAEENQRVVDTGIVFDDVTIDMLYCDDTEVIEEHLANYQRCATEHRQLAKWLKELQAHREAWEKVSKRINLWKQDSERSDSIYAIGRMEAFQKSLEIIAEYRPKEGDSE